MLLRTIGIEYFVSSVSDSEKSGKDGTGRRASDAQKGESEFFRGLDRADVSEATCAPALKDRVRVPRWLVKRFSQGQI
jgi:hypothetical protein